MYTESFKGLCLNPDGFYLVILPLGSRWVLMKYINPLGTTKTLVFHLDLNGLIYFYTLIITLIMWDYVSTSALWCRA